VNDLGLTAMRLMGQMMRLPVTVFAFALESFARTLQGLDRQLDPAVDRHPDPRAEPATPAAPAPLSRQNTAHDPKEELHMAETNLNDDFAKLIQYSIVSIGRDRPDEKKLLLSDQIVVTENMTGDSFATWMIARFIQDEGMNFPHAEKKYLRVYYNVLDRWPQPDLEYEESQLNALRGIQRAIRDLQPNGNGNGGGNPQPINPGD